MSSEIEYDEISDVERSEIERSDLVEDESSSEEGDYGEEDLGGEDAESGGEKDDVAEKGAATFKQQTQQLDTGEGEIDPKTLEGKIKLTIIKYTKEYFSDRAAQDNIMKKIMEGKLYSIEELATYNIPYIVAITIWNNKKGLLNNIDPKDEEQIKDFTEFGEKIDDKFQQADPPVSINTVTLYRYYRLIKNKIDTNIDVYRYIDILELNVKADFFDNLFKKYGFNEFNDIPSKVDKNNLFLLYYWFIYIEKDPSFTLDPPKKEGDKNHKKLLKLVKFFNEKRKLGGKNIEISKGNYIPSNYFGIGDKKFMVERLK